MSLAHLTLATREVETTASFLERTLGYVRDPVPENVPCESIWLNIGRRQQIGEGQGALAPVGRFAMRSPAMFARLMVLAIGGGFFLMIFAVAAAAAAGEKLRDCIGH